MDETYEKFNGKSIELFSLIEALTFKELIWLIELFKRMIFCIWKLVWLFHGIANRYSHIGFVRWESFWMQSEKSRTFEVLGLKSLNMA